MFSTFPLHKVPLTAAIMAALGIQSMPAFAAPGDPLGGEFLVNTSTIANQEHPAAAMNTDGSFIVVWESLDADTGNYGIYTQRYNASGERLGGETRINTTQLNDQSIPKIAMNAAGNYVVVWENSDQNGDWNIYARRFKADGAPVGNDLQINSTVISALVSGTVPGVGIDAAGDFIIGWENYDNVNNNEDIYARRFDSAGTALGNEFLVNTSTTNDQTLPAVAMNANGDFVVAWQSAVQDSDGSMGIYAQHYDANGAALGSEFQVNSTATGDQTSPAAAMNTAGDFAVTWESAGQDGDGKGIYAQRYDATGTALGEFRVNTATASDQTAPVIVMNASDEFIVVWESLNQDGDGKGIYAQRYDANGAALGGEYKANTTTANTQMLPAVALNANIDSVVAWQSAGQDDPRFPHQFGIYAQRYVGNVAASSSGAGAGGGGGGGGAFGWFSALLILPALLRRRATRIYKNSVPMA